VEAQILESIGVDFIDESEVLTPADETHHINKHNFKVPVLCGCRNLGEALRRIAEARAHTQNPACVRTRVCVAPPCARHRATTRRMSLTHALLARPSPAHHPRRTRARRAPL
jgi:hypothetical protein